MAKMTMCEVRSLGGQVTGKILRKKALDDYYSNPNFCLGCSQRIEVRGGEKIPRVKRRKFCNRSCAVTYHNRKSPKRLACSTKQCDRCGVVVYLKKNKRGGYYKRKYCDICGDIVKGVGLGGKHIGTMTKGELFDKRSSWTVARNGIRAHAVKVYIRNKGERKCKVCGYDITFEVCHIKDVSEFSNDTTIEKINDFCNLVGLCPNHHWEFDHGLIVL